MMFWEMYQMQRIGSAESAANRTKSDLTRALDKVDRLEKKVEGLALACQTLWEILRNQTELTEEDFKSKMEEIDLRDGKLDGKMSPAVEACPKCGRQTTRRRAHCIYCGVTVNEAEVFGTK